MNLGSIGGRVAFLMYEQYRRSRATGWIVWAPEARLKRVITRPYIGRASVPLLATPLRLQMSA